MTLILSIVLLIVLSGLFSGLTIGLFSLDRADLIRKTELGNKDAQRVMRVRKHGNRLLVTLLLGNVAVNAAISILLGEVASGFIAGLIATALIVIFGEIIPQATCTRYAMKVGAKTAWIVELFLIGLYPIAWPIAWVLDKALGEELNTVWSKRELEHIIRMHEDDPRSHVDADEERIILGALTYSDKRAKDVLTPRKEVFALEAAQPITQTLLHQIRESGHTRIPLFQKSLRSVAGILYAKDLIGAGTGKPLSSFMRTDDVVRVTPARRLDGLLNLMIHGHAHLAVVTHRNGHFAGIVTMEDILEEILGREIEDEEAKRNEK